MFGYIYKTTNLINGMLYIGKHQCDHFDFEKYKGSGNLLRQAFKKYGKENFKCELLEGIPEVPVICNSLEELNESELFYTQYYDCVNSKKYYNLKEGGDGGAGPRSDKTIELLKIANKDKCYVYKENDCRRIKLTQLDEYLSKGYKRGMRDYKRTESFKQKISETTKGKICIHKNTKQTRIFPEELDKYLAEGWELGWNRKAKVYSIESGEGKKKWMFNPSLNEYKCVYESNFNKYLEAGWIFKGPSHKSYEHKKGYKASETAKANMSKAHLGEKHTPERIKKHADLLKGRKYMHKDGVKKLIKKDEEELYLSLGWKYGKKD